MKNIYEAYQSVLKNNPESRHQADAIGSAYVDKIIIKETTLDYYGQEKIDRLSGYNDSELSDETEEKIHKALGDKQFTHFPLTNNTNSVDPDVVEHLANHGYDIDDYQKGIAAKKTIVGNPSKGIPNREKIVKKSIGSVLQETNADASVMKAFLHDPARAASRAGNLHCVITRTPYGVGGMSTGTSWKSCMNLHNGEFRTHIKDDLAHGTHVAYLVHGDDETAFNHGEPSKPIGRIALKPFHSDENPNETIFRPETTSYGNVSTEFRNAVSSWALSKYPAIPGHTYTKNSKVYDDSDDKIYKAYTVKEITDKLDAGQHPFEGKPTGVDHEVIDGAIKHIQGMSKEKQTQAIENIVSINNMTPKHVVDLYNVIKTFEPENRKSAMWSLGVRAGNNFSTNMHKEFSEYYPDRIPTLVAMSPKLPEESVDKLSIDQLAKVRRKLIKPHHVQRVVDASINGESGSYYAVKDLAWAMNSHHIDQLVKGNKNDGATTFIASHPAMSKETFDYAWNNGSESQKNILLGHSRHAKFDHFLDHTTGNADIDTLNYFSKNPHITPEDATKLADHLANNINKYNRGTKHYWLSIRDNFGKHLQEHHYKAIANEETKPIRFENPNHSWKYLKAINDKAIEGDQKLENHELDDDGENDHWNTMQHYENAIDRHITDHIADNNGIVRDRDEHDKMTDWLDTIHYKFHNDGNQFECQRNRLSDMYDDHHDLY